MPLCGEADISVHMLARSQRHQVTARAPPLACPMCLRGTMWWQGCTSWQAFHVQALPSGGMGRIVHAPVVSQCHHKAVWACPLMCLPCLDVVTQQSVHACLCIYHAPMSSWSSASMHISVHTCLHACYVPVAPCGGLAHLSTHLTCPDSAKQQCGEAYLHTF